MTFPIDEGTVRIDAEIDKTSIRAAATAAGKQAGDDLEKSTRDSFDRSASGNRGLFSNILRKAITPSAGAFTALRAPFAAALSTPIGAAMIGVAGVAALAFVGAFAAALATAGLGAVFLGIGAAALLGGKQARDEAQADLDKAEESVRKAQERAKSGTAAAKQSLAEARAELAEAQKVVADNRAFVNLDSALGNLGKTLRDVGVAAAMPLMKPLTEALNDLAELARQLRPELTTIFTALAPAIPALTEGISGFVAEFLKLLAADPAALAGMRDALIAIGANLPQLGAALGELFAMLATNQNNVRNIGILFDILAFSIVQLGVGLTVLSTLLDYIIAGWTKVITAGSAVISWITGTFVPGVVSMWNTVTSTGATVLAWFQALPGQIVAFLQGLPAMLGSLFTRALSAAAFAVGYGIGTIIKFFINLPGNILSALAALPGLIAGVFNRARSTAVSVASTIVSGVVSILRTLPGAAASAVSSVGSRILGVLRSIPGAARGIGADIIRGLISGINSMIGAAVAAARRAVGSIIDGAKSALGIGSPSKVFAAIGVDTLRGLAGGLGNTQIVERAMSGVVDAVSGFGGLGMTSPTLSAAGVGSVGGGIPMSSPSRQGGGTSAVHVGGVTVNVGVVDPDRAAQVGVDIANGFWDQLARTRTAR